VSFGIGIGIAIAIADRKEGSTLDPDRDSDADSDRYASTARGRPVLRGKPKPRLPGVVDYLGAEIISLMSLLNSSRAGVSRYIM
jgi:hypothetical protein